MQKDQAYVVALKRIEKARKTRATRLDLAELGLKTLPPEIGQLSSVRTLSFYGNQLATLPALLSQLSSLREPEPRR